MHLDTLVRVTHTNKRIASRKKLSKGSCGTLFFNYNPYKFSFFTIPIRCYDPKLGGFIQSERPKKNSNSKQKIYFLDFLILFWYTFPFLFLKT
jgi:hypothetical protein